MSMSERRFRQVLLKVLRLAVTKIYGLHRNSEKQSRFCRCPRHVHFLGAKASSHSALCSRLASWPRFVQAPPTQLFGNGKSYFLGYQLTVMFLFALGCCVSRLDGQTLQGCREQIINSCHYELASFVVAITFRGLRAGLQSDRQ